MFADKRPEDWHGWVNAGEKSRIDVLSNGRPVLIRHVEQADRAREYALVRHSAPASRHAFLLRQQHEPQKGQGCIALVHDNGRVIEIGASRYTAMGQYQCECAVTVATAWKRLGLGTLLLEHLIDAARSNGVHQLYSVGASSNAPLRELARFLGFEAHDDPFDPHQVIHRLYL
ncbi:Acetyltransferase (GNAT) family protein [compost metagenome]|jgi:GNAT superfamily N-acetyltransferase|uniref:GNAT family N-acetyltransferase n=1 Tax=Pseudomonas serbica TaxID=2965074 RepID=UPI000FB462FB|nr:GNAT family N-acetyltransferase [Pseudomonas serbica]NBB62262.1 GNAT family N-acetyltransferase [Pseudomonas sp. ODNR1LW]